MAQPYTSALFLIEDLKNALRVPQPQQLFTRIENRLKNSSTFHVKVDQYTFSPLTQFRWTNEFQAFIKRLKENELTCSLYQLPVLWKCAYGKVRFARSETAKLDEKKNRINFFFDLLSEEDWKATHDCPMPWIFRFENIELMKHVKQKYEEKNMDFPTLSDRREIDKFRKYHVLAYPVPDVLDLHLYWTIKSQIAYFDGHFTQSSKFQKIAKLFEHKKTLPTIDEEEAKIEAKEEATFHSLTKVLQTNFANLTSDQLENLFEMMTDSTTSMDQEMEYMWAAIPGTTKEMVGISTADEDTEKNAEILTKMQVAFRKQDSLSKQYKMYCKRNPKMTSKESFEKVQELLKRLGPPEKNNSQEVNSKKRSSKKASAKTVNSKKANSKKQTTPTKRKSLLEFAEPSSLPTYPANSIEYFEKKCRLEEKNGFPNGPGQPEFFFCDDGDF